MPDRTRWDWPRVCAPRGPGRSADAARKVVGVANIPTSGRVLFVANHSGQVPIDAAIGWTQQDGTRAHRRAGTTVDDNMADPDRIAETYLQLHRQHRSTWAFEVVLRPWVEKW